MQSANSIEFRKFGLRKLRVPRLIVHNTWAWIMCFFCISNRNFIFRCFLFLFCLFRFECDEFHLNVFSSTIKNAFNFDLLFWCCGFFFSLLCIVEPDFFIENLSTWRMEPKCMEKNSNFYRKKTIWNDCAVDIQPLRYRYLHKVHTNSAYAKKSDILKNVCLN